MNRVIFGDCRNTMRDLKAQGVRVQCCVTSPPYFGLRDYGHPGQIGLEKTPSQFVAALVEVFDGVRDLLADDGVLWLNLGDSYNAAGRTGHGTRQGFKQGTNRASAEKADNCRPSVDNLKPKDLIGIPWRVAFALQEAGWYLRQDIIWHKPNPMPESVTDRCTKSHEYIFLLSKSERYFFNNDAIREPWEGEAAKAVAMGTKEVGQRGINASARRGLTDGQATQFKKQGHSGYFGADGKCLLNPLGANKRSVWRVATRPYKGAHFATFPPALIEPCILAGSRPGDLVLDPFIGSGTTGQVAQALGRLWIGCELNEAFAPLQQARTAQAALAI
jgi:DNA modification methylase